MSGREEHKLHIFHYRVHSLSSEAPLRPIEKRAKGTKGAFGIMQEVCISAMLVKSGMFCWEFGRDDDDR